VVVVEGELTGAAREATNLALARFKRSEKLLTRGRRGRYHSTRCLQRSHRTVHPAQLVLDELAAPCWRSQTRLTKMTSGAA